MRNYLILKEKARQFNEDSEIQSLLAEIRSPTPESNGLMESYSRAKAAQLKSMTLDRTVLTTRKLPYERLDQLTVDILLGVR
jgi:xylose isomerase